MEVTVPSDAREIEVFLATNIGIAGLIWVILQVLGAFSGDVHPWASLYSSLLLLAGGANVLLRQGKELRQAVAGIERLILRDEDRQAHVDASAFLAGYLLGLPCFCYKPDVAEALKMMQSKQGNLCV